MNRLQSLKRLEGGAATETEAYPKILFSLSALLLLLLLLLIVVLSYYCPSPRPPRALL